MHQLVKLSLAVVAGFTLAACSEQTTEQSSASVTQAPVVATEAPAAETPAPAVDEHAGHNHDAKPEATAASEATKNDPFQQDVHYRVLETALPVAANHVHEFFWYGCPACKATEPLMQSLKADEKLKVEVNPSLLNEKWVFDAVIYQAFKHFGKLDTLHPLYFEARQSGSIKDQAGFEQFLSDNGIKPDEFNAFAQSDELKASLDASFEVERQLQSTGVPTLVVGGKYVLLNRGFDSTEQMHQAIGWLSEKK
ncbi:DsbA family protein [Motilimonas pumila]|uniref:DSBA-like thioredoxin domain-containing protein n=1 Tax=Motilimonas pumila TaxID=2303987 RepID=A0A418YCU9_9GAMM|nr:DsbA family protein [Motilimonas pumila]RJG42328.1 hypothetical protein D1Z90_13700 [Motilimonas pumila]